MDIAISVDRLPRGGETIPGGDIALFPGGKKANQACAAAKLAGSACFIAQVIDDPFGEALLASLKQAASLSIPLRPGPCGRSSRAESIFRPPNQSETAALLGKPLWKIRDFADAKRAAKGLLALGPSAVAIKPGALGCAVATSGMCAHVEGFQVEAVDTTAAGDAFNDAFAAALANAAGAVCVTRDGTQACLPTRDELDRFVKLGSRVPVGV